MAKINQEEYEVLKELDNKWKWIARAESRAVKTFLSKPHKRLHWIFDSSGSWDIKGNENFGIYTNYADLFQFIQWEDKEPHNIAELIEEYEFENVLSDKEQFEEWYHGTESEEAEVKNIEWLKEEITEVLLTSKKDGTNYFYYKDLKEKIYNAVDQLDEPETLSQEWIDERKVPIFWTAEEQDAVRVEHLKNLLVPKQEDMFNGEKPDEGEVYFAIGLEGAVEINVARGIDEAIEILIKHETNYTVSKKPVIPKFVAEWIEENHERNTMIELSHLNDSLSSQNMKKEHKLYFWIKENFDTFAEAWIAYPNVEVEKEQKYYVMNNDNRMMLVRMMDGKTITESDPFKLEDMYEVEKKSHCLTEQEIKGYDERYWAFAKPVEEME